MQAPHEQGAAAAAAEATTAKKILIIMRGAPGSGKSSAALAIASKLDAENVGICSADYFFYNKEGEYQFNPPKLLSAHDFCHKTFLALIRQEVETIILDNTNIKLEHYQAYIKAAKENGYEVMQCIPGNKFKNIHAVAKSKVNQMAQAFEKDDELPQFPAPKTGHRKDLHEETLKLVEKARRALQPQAASGAGTSPHAFLAAKSGPTKPDSEIAPALSKNA